MYVIDFSDMIKCDLSFIECINVDIFRDQMRVYVQLCCMIVEHVISSLLQVYFGTSLVPYLYACLREYVIDFLFINCLCTNNRKIELL